MKEIQKHKELESRYSSKSSKTKYYANINLLRENILFYL